MRKTKIIATLGPATEDIATMKEMILAGCDVARLNVAHGTVEYHRTLYERFRKASDETEKITAVMLDIKGPELRVERCERKEVKSGEKLTVAEDGDISFNHDIYRFLSPGTRVLIHDGDIVLKMTAEEEALVLTGGVIRERMGVNVPGVDFPLQYIQERDMLFLEALRDVDYIAASFVRSAEDVLILRRELEKRGIRSDIVAKIESARGVENIDEILEVSDGIMVARGDLGTEIPVERLPEVQKHLLRKTRIHGKPGIIATQILESMIHNPHPTRAEVSDIANAILDGGDALMLSGETAVGKYPIESIRILSRVAERADALISSEMKEIELRGTISESVSNAAVLMAREINADAILVITRSGKTARLVSRHRVPMPMLVATPHDEILRKLSLFWGVHAFKIGRIESTDQAVKEAMALAELNSLVNRGDLLVIVGGELTGIPGTTNFVWAQIMGDIIARGTGFGEKRVRGKLCRYPGRCDVVIMEELLEECAGKAVLVESKIYDTEKIERMVEKGVVVIAGTGKIKEYNVEVTVDPVRGVVWK